MDLSTWDENLYDDTFTPAYNALLTEFEEGKITLEAIENNITEFNTVLMNASTEGNARFQYCTALIDAHEYALAVIKKRNNL